ncbi:MAG: GIY-YIG nuclease family protein [gamma proteobacterium symbiont of Phacoides pectinatus]
MVRAEPAASPGTYVLLMHLPAPRRIRVGALGVWRLRAGWYAYAGSAFGPGGVAARCRHHRGRGARPRWHVDYIRAVAALHEIWFNHDPLPREHLWATLLAASRGAVAPVRGFGSSDCGCWTHLLFSEKLFSFYGVTRRARVCVADHARIWRQDLSYGEH